MRTFAHGRLYQQSEGSMSPATGSAASPGVLIVVDSLILAGLERVAVNIANALPANRYRGFLCATRVGGPLESAVAQPARFVILRRKSRLDLRALWQCVLYVSRHNVKILHAHGTSLFFSVLVSLFPPFPKVVWHVHYGRFSEKNHLPLPYRTALRRVAGILTVSQQLCDWARNAVRSPDVPVRFVPNFVDTPPLSLGSMKVPGSRGSRVVCVANFVPEKNHEGLLQAWTKVVERHSSAHLILAGKPLRADCYNRAHSLIAAQGLSTSVTWIGSVDDIAGLLGECDVGVLPSSSEGFPMVLLEYGMSRLPTIATSVGQSPEILGHGSAGVLVPPRDPDALGAAILRLLSSSRERQEYGSALYDRVSRTYSTESAIGQICELYDQVLVPRRKLS